LENGQDGDVVQMGTTYGQYERGAEGWTPRWPWFGGPVWRGAQGPPGAPDPVCGPSAATSCRQL